MSHPAHPHAKEEEFSLPLFAFTVLATLAVILGVLRWLAPASVWQEQIHAGFGHVAAAFLLITLYNCFVEFFFHRYVLHKPVVPLLSHLYRQHTLHHSLTRIGRRRTPGGREVPFVENLYPITQPEQKEASFFPWFSLGIFAVIMAPMLALLQWIAPSFPWFFAGFGALAASLTLYEVFHAIEHWSFEKWGPLIEGRRTGAFWRMVYSFHLRHHAVIDCNEAISGFFTLPLADWTFGTYVMPKTLYAEGEEWKPAEFTSPRPRRLIAWCDRATDAVVQKRRLRAQAPREAAAETGISRGEEIAYRLTHGLGLFLSGVGLALLVTFACLRGDVWRVISFSVFGVTLVLVYAVSMFYHSLRAGYWKVLFLKIDRAAVFLLIAGTYTPFLLVSLRGPWGWSLFGAVWGLCAVGAILQLVLGERFRMAARIAYFGLGWLALIAIKPALAALPDGGFWLLLAGGLCYTVGLFLNFEVRLPYHRAVRRAFVLGGSACHVLAVLLFVLPAAV